MYKVKEITKGIWVKGWSHFVVNSSVNVIPPKNLNDPTQYDKGA